MVYRCAPAPARARSAADLGVDLGPSPLDALPGPSQARTPGEILRARLGFFDAQAYGIGEVQYAGYEWRAADGSMGWQPDTTKNDPPRGSIVAG